MAFSRLVPSTNPIKYMFMTQNFRSINSLGKRHRIGSTLKLVSDQYIFGDIATWWRRLYSLLLYGSVCFMMTMKFFICFVNISNRSQINFLRNLFLFAHCSCIHHDDCGQRMRRRTFSKEWWSYWSISRNVIFF